MVMVTKPGIVSPLRPEPGQNEFNSLYPIILATVILCSVLTTVFTAARLFTKRLISSYGPEDCECQMLSLSTRHAADMVIYLDLLMVAWVSTRSTANVTNT